MARTKVTQPGSRHQLALGVGLALGLSMVLGVTPMISAAESAATDTGVHQRWTQTFPARLDPVAVAAAPHRTSVAFTTLPRNQGVATLRYGPRGHIRWNHVWRGPGGRVKRLTPQAVTVSRQSRSVLVAGQAVCRFQGDAIGLQSTLFVRRYTLGGDRRWTHWLGRCPPKSSDRHGRILSVSDVDVWANRVAVAFTQGHSFDCCVHHRKGHVAVLGLHGNQRWHKRIRFPSSDASEIVTAGVAGTRRIVAVSGTVDHGVNGSDSYLVALSAIDGSAQWRRVLTGHSDPNRDEGHFLDAASGAIFMTARFDDVPEGGGGHVSLQRWNTSGERAWRARLPTLGIVSAQHNRSVMWSGAHYKNDRHTTFAVGLQRPSGIVGWRDRFALPRGDYPVGYAFAATRQVGIGGAFVMGSPGARLQIWAWRWR